MREVIILRIFAESDVWIAVMNGWKASRILNPRMDMPAPPAGRKILLVDSHVGGNSVEETAGGMAEWIANSDAYYL